MASGPRSGGRGRSGKPIAPRKIARYAVIALVSLFLLVTGIRLGMSEVLADRDPTAALRYWSSNSEALARRAAERLYQVNASAADLAASSADARRAIMLDPSVRGAFTSLALSGADDALALRRVRYAEMQSRRDLATQMFLIERSVRANDIDEALRHYDTALRTTVAANEILFPVLVEAAREPEIAIKLARILKTSPGWEIPFYNFAIGTAASSDGVVRIDAALIGLGSGMPIEQRVYLLQRLERESRFGDALALYERYVPSGRSLVRNGNFEHENVYAPVDWVLREDPDIGSERAAGVAGRSEVLLLHASEGVSGEVARQILALPRGRPFTLRFLSSGARMGGQAPVVTVTCASTTQNLVEASIATLGTIAVRGHAPGPDCAYQWLRVVVPSTPIPDNVWIDDIAIETD